MTMPVSSLCFWPWGQLWLALAGLYILQNIGIFAVLVTDPLFQFWIYSLNLYGITPRLFSHRTMVVFALEPK